MNNIELNAILYYADYLSLKAISKPVTDNCKYFFIHGAPINSLFILDLEPIYDENNEYFKQSKTEYEIIRDKFGDDGVESFIDDICCIKACGTVDAKLMLKKIHQYSNKTERKQAFQTYNNWKNSQKYTHLTINEKGEAIETRCSSYVYHVERMLGKSGVLKTVGTYTLERN